MIPEHASLPLVVAFEQAGLGGQLWANDKKEMMGTRGGSEVFPPKIVVNRKKV